MTYIVTPNASDPPYMRTHCDQCGRELSHISKFPSSIYGYAVRILCSACYATPVDSSDIRKSHTAIPVVSANSIESERKPQALPPREV